MFFTTPTNTARFMAAQPWYASLPLATQTRLLESLICIKAKKGEVALQANQPAQGWYAVMSGLVTVQTISVEGRSSAFLGAAAGDWFGEGTALKNELRRYEVIALRDSELMCLPLAEFHALRADSMAFNHFLVDQLNLRLGQAMALIEASRLRTPEQRVALSLSRLFWHRSRKLNLSQDELASLVGVSRQTVNRALQSLVQRGLISLEFGRVAIADDEALTRLIFASPEDLAKLTPT
jgi:CRP/FNR family transcriptional regulator, cyclic AMP receptor protein